VTDHEHPRGGSRKGSQATRRPLSTRWSRRRASGPPHGEKAAVGRASEGYAGAGAGDHLRGTSHVLIRSGIQEGYWLMKRDTERDAAIEKLAELIHQIRIAMLTTLTEQGAFQSRPITTHGARFDGDLWFLTHVDSGKLGQVRQHRRVGLTYASPTNNTYVALSGTAEVVVDRAKAEELWDPSYQAWFPGGPSDPDLALIKVTVERAEYWAAPALTWPLSAGFVVMAADQRDDPRFHARIVLDQRGRPAPSDPRSRD
jgi:general stress protein 26